MQVTDTVRVIRTAGLIRTALFATVLSVQQPHQDDDGTNGEPTITIAYLDPEKVSLLGGPKWYEAFRRVPTVRHVSHADVQSGAEEYCYTEVLPSDGDSVHLQRVNMDAEDGPPAEAAEAEDTIGTIVYINHNNDLSVLHRNENSFVVVSRSRAPAHEPFSDLFSAKVYVDAQPKAEQQTGAVGRISGSPLHLVAAQLAAEGAAKQQQAAGLQPSAADLDAVAAEQKAAEETGGEELAIETKEYTDGTTATGVAPLPDQSPAQQDAAEAQDQQ